MFRTHSHTLAFAVMWYSLVCFSSAPFAAFQLLGVQFKIQHVLSTACTSIKYCGAGIHKHLFSNWGELMCFIVFYTKVSVCNSCTNTCFIFHQTIPAWPWNFFFQTALFICPVTRFLTKPHGNKNLSEKYRGSELTTPSFFPLIYIVLQR